jgi:hypothetical protein
VNWLPTVIWVRVTPDSTPEVVTGTGTPLLMVEPFPSSPRALSPQQYALPPRIMHEWLSPDAIVVADADTAEASGADTIWIVTLPATASVAAAPAAAHRRAAVRLAAGRRAARCRPAAGSAARRHDLARNAPTADTNSPVVPRPVINEGQAALIPPFLLALQRAMRLCSW